MTLLVGMYYDDKKGAVIATDSRIIKNPEYRLGRKINQAENFIIADSGLSWVGSELFEKVRLIMEMQKDIPTKEIIDQIQNEIYKKYGTGEEPRLMEEELSQGIFIVYLNQPELFRFYERVIEPIDDFIAVGQEDDSVEGFLQKFYKNNITKEKAIKLAVYSIAEVSKYNINVDNNPQIALMDYNGCRILNWDKNRNIDFQKPEILRIKKKVNEIDKFQKKSFEILLGEDQEKKDKLIRLLNKL